MEGNGYFMPLKNEKKYSPYEFDNIMSKKENNMDNLGKKIDQDIYNNAKMVEKKTPLVLTPKLMLNNNSNNIKDNYNYNINGINLSNSIKKYPSTSLIFSNQQNLNIIDNRDTNLNDQYINMDEDNINISTIHWKYNGPTGLNTEKKHFPTKLNIGNYFKTPLIKKTEPVKLNQSDYINSYDLYTNSNIRNNNIFNSNYNYNINNSYEINKEPEKEKERHLEYNDNPNYKSQKIIHRPLRSRSEDVEKIDPFPYDTSNRERNLYKYEEQPEPMLNRYNRDRTNRNYNNVNEEEVDEDNYSGNRQYKYYNPKRNDYKGSRYGDYTYNYYLNAPMRGDKTRSWKFPPLYYYNSGDNLPKRNDRYQK